MQVQPYVFFDGRCDEALEFYKKALGAQVKMLMRFKDGPPQNPEHCPGGKPVPGDKVMHAEMVIGETTILVSDGNSTGNPKFDGFSLAIGCKTVDEVERLWKGLSDGGKPIAPLMETFFSPKFGMIADKFGVTWMVLVNSNKPA